VPTTAALPVLASAGLFALVGCGGGGTRAPTQQSATPSLAAETLATTCTQAPIIKSGGLTAQAEASFASKRWTLRFSVAPFTGAQAYAVTLARKTWLEVALVSGGASSDQDRVTRELQAAPGVTGVNVLPTDRTAPPGVVPVQLRVTVSSASAVDGVLPSLHEDPAVNPIITADSFFIQSEPATPAEITLEPSDNSAPLHSVSGSVTPTSDGHSGSFDVVVEYPFTHGQYHLVGQWNCPLPQASIGTAGTTLGTPTVTVTINDQATSFSPASVTVRVGQIVEWMVPAGKVPFSVSFPNDPDVSSNVLTAGSTWEIRFTRPGTYQYTDTLHPGDNGAVIVSP
jgi:plastocyanin